MENKEKHELMQKYIQNIIKRYRRVEITIYDNFKVMLTRNGIVGDFKAFYHFNFNTYSIHISFWCLVKKMWIDNIIFL